MSPDEKQFMAALSSMDADSATRLAHSAIEADPDRYPYDGAMHDPFAMAFILAFEGRPVTAYDIEQLDRKIHSFGPDVYAWMYRTARDRGMDLLEW